ncbi:MAG TPA: thioether cross-link-forming SCIFF peptide maturase, partial [Bacillota bacterium]|nr:thioether cross-link-forming SCIFF peptide maturase [Bacillota bacterium]
MGEIHKFIFKGKRLVLDVESNALHEFDQVAWQVLELLERGDGDAEIAAHLAPVYGADAVKGALSEIRLLQREGLLFSEARESGSSAPAVVKALCLFAADNCNLRCRYCFVEQGRPHREETLMSETVGKAAIDFLVAASGPRR